MKSKSTSIKLLVIVTLVLLSLAYLLPIYVTIVTSLKSIEEINATNYLVPTLIPKFENFTEVLFGSLRFRSEMIPRLGNSMIISFSVTFLACFFGGMGGYYLARNRSIFAQILFILVGIALYLPYQAVIIPLVVLMAKTRLALTY